MSADREKHPGVRIHESAYVDDPCVIGAGTSIWHFTHVSAGAKIGRHCVLGQNVFVAPDVELGDNVKVQNNVSIYTGVSLEDDVFCGPSLVFTNVVNPRSEIVRKHEFRPTVVRRGATLGANATVVCGIEIGRYAFVAAGAVVTKDVAPYALMAGVPARRIGWMCRCGERLPGEAAEGGAVTCDMCGNAYVIEGDRVTPVAETQAQKPTEAHHA